MLAVIPICCASAVYLASDRIAPCTLRLGGAQRRPHECAWPGCVVVHSRLCHCTQLIPTPLDVSGCDSGNNHRLHTAGACASRAPSHAVHTSPHLSSMSRQSHFGSTASMIEPLLTWCSQLAAQTDRLWHRSQPLDLFATLRLTHKGLRRRPPIVIT